MIRTIEKFARIFCSGSCAEISGKKSVPYFISETRYKEEMRNPNRGWKCPSCGEHPCGFDDKFFEQKLHK